MKRVPSFIKEKAKNLEGISGPETSYIYTAATTGYKVGKQKELKEKWKTLGILHLLTPSGIHLGTILLLFRFLGRFKKYGEWLLGAMLLSVGGFYSMERIFIIRRLSFKNHFYNYLLGMLIMLVFGHYSASPLSFIYSFLFLGLFYTGTKKILTKLTIAHLIICWFNQTEFYLFAPIFNFVLTFVFSLTFPIILVSYWQPFSAIHRLGLFIVNTFNELVEIVFPFLLKTPLLNSSWALFILLICLLMRWRLGIIALLFI